MAVLQTSDILGRLNKGQTTFDAFKDETGNREAQVRMNEILSNIISISGSEQHYSMFAFNGQELRDGQYDNLYRQFVNVLSEEVSADKTMRGPNGKKIDRTIELPLFSMFKIGGLEGVLGTGPNPDHAVMPWGFSSQGIVYAETNKVDFGIIGMVTDYSKFDEETTILGSFAHFYATNEMKLGLYERLLERSTMTHSLPSIFNTFDYLSYTELEQDFLPTIGQSKNNKTAPVKRFVVGNHTSVSDISKSDIITQTQLNTIAETARANGIVPNNIMDGVEKWILTMDRRSSRRFVGSLGTNTQNIINIAQQGSMDWQKNPLYFYAYQGLFPGYGDFEFAYNDFVTSDPTVLKYLDPVSGKESVSNVMEFITRTEEANIRNINGTGASPAARVVGLVDNGTNFSNIGFAFNKKKEQSEVLTQFVDGTLTANDKFLLLDRIGAQTLFGFSHKSDRTQIAKDSLMAHPITAAESALGYCNMNTGDIAGEICLSDHYKNVGTNQADNVDKWKIIYTGPYDLGSFTFSSNATANILPERGQTVAEIVSALRIQAIYKWNSATTTWETTPVSDANLVAELDAIKTSLMIDANDIIAPAVSATGDYQLDDQISKRRRVHYFNTAFSFVLGQGVMTKAIPYMSQSFSGTEKRFYEFYSSEVIYRFIGHKLHADPITGQPIGAMLIMYFAGGDEIVQ